MSEYVHMYLRKCSAVAVTNTYHLLYTCSGLLGEKISLVTRSDDSTFSSFVNAVVTATINAVEDGISRENSHQMPLIDLFGYELRYMFRDVIRYFGNYDDIYLEAHKIENEEDVDRGFNSVLTLEGKFGLYWGPSFG